MKYTLSVIILILTPLFLFAQEMTLSENSEVVECGRTLRMDGIWIDNGHIKADLSILMQKNSKPITGSYKMGDTIDIKNGCRLYIKLIEKFGLNSNSGYVVFSKEQEIADYLNIRLSNLSLYEKFNIGNSEWTVKSISKDDAEFEFEDGLNLKTVRLKKNDIIWKGFTAYYISDFLANASDKLNEQLTIELKEVKDYSYLRGPVISGKDMNAPLTIPSGETELIIRKMKLYPKKRVDEEELKNTPVKYWVLKVLYYHGGIARPVIEVERNGKKMNLEFDAYKSFDTEEEVMEFARVNNITDIILEEK